MRTLCINVFEGIPADALYPLIREAGFDGFFSSPELADDLPALTERKRAAVSVGLFQETVHGTIAGCTSIWRPGPEGDRFVETLYRNIDHCKALDVPILVVHPQKDGKAAADTALGLERLSGPVEYAGKAGVRIAFENANSEELLYAVMERFQAPHVGFCYDSGHEFWLTPGARFLRDFRSRLLCTHLNDNDGQSDRHWIPGDGCVDYDRICEDLRGYSGPLTLELAYGDRYRGSLTEREYLARCYTVLSEMAQKLDS